MAGIFENNKIRIKLSNTESIKSNIFKFTNLKKEGKIKPSSTAGYFLNTNIDLIEKMKEFLKCDTDEFIVDVLKTRKYIEQMDQIVKMFSLADFHNNLSEYYDKRGYYFATDKNFSIGKPDCSVDDGNRLNIKFDNLENNVKRFRGVIIAILCDLIIEKHNNANLIYPVLKDGIVEMIKRDYNGNKACEENDMREKFKKWLQKKGSSESSVDAYVSQIELMSKEAIEEGLITKELYKIYEIEELNNVVPLIVESENFKRRVENSNNINSAALNHYIDFLKMYYDKDLFLKEVFIDDPMEYEKMYNLLKRKKNLILKGSPGVGKTFMAKRLAYSIIGEKAKDQILSVQFHQSFSYEDFIEGIRPKKGDEGKFVITPGMFYDFVETALKNANKDYYVIIDEINRGNLSKIFGELMKLIETDKRYDFDSSSYEYVILPYSRKEFKIPKNIYIIGTMNTADRSLAMVDYALRRRFAFYNVSPKYDSNKFKDWLKKKNGLKEVDINEIITRMKKVNASIVEDLNDGFAIGHSYFVDTIDPNKFKQSYDEIKEYEIMPLIEEYFIDDSSKIENYKNML